MQTQKFIGRKKELGKLSDLLDRKNSSLVVIKGRRRIGKSRLAQEFAKQAKGYDAYYFSALPPNPQISVLDEREDFAQQLSKEFSIPLPRADHWNTLLWTLADRVKFGKCIVILDEINWMGSKDPTFLGKLKLSWDRDLSKIPNLILILCGSLTSWIDQNILHNTGFLGRITLDITLQELSLRESVQFWGARKRIDAYEKFKILSITGGIPRYLEEIDPKKSSDENIHRLCFEPSGLLFREFDNLFDDLFKKRNRIYRDIIETIAEKPMGLDLLHEKLNRQQSGVLSQYVDELEKCGFLLRDYTWSIKSGKESKLSRLRLCDNYLRFYLKGIAIHRKNIERKHFTPRNLDSLLGLQFENLVLNNRDSIWEAIRINYGDIIFENPFFQRPTKRQKGCQIDYMIQTRRNTLYICEIKFLNKPIDPSIISEIQTKINRISLPRYFSYRPVLIHVNGVSDAVRETEFFDEIIDFRTLLNHP